MAQKGEYAGNLNVIQFYHPKLEIEINLSENPSLINSTVFSEQMREQNGTKKDTPCTRECVIMFMSKIGV